MYNWLRKKIASWLGRDEQGAPHAPPAPASPSVERAAASAELRARATVAPAPSTGLPGSSRSNTSVVIPVSSVVILNGDNHPIEAHLDEESSSTLVQQDPDSIIPTVSLLRTSSSSHGTFGIIRTGSFQAVSLELPWRNNMRSISCVPKGTYIVDWTYSPRFRRMMYVLENVPGRDGIRFHSANLAGDKLMGLKTQLNGCITMGARIGVLSGQKAVLQSAPTLVKFEEVLNHKKFRLIIGGVVG